MQILFEFLLELIRPLSKLSYFKITDGSNESKA